VNEREVWAFGLALRQLTPLQMRVLVQVDRGVGTAKEVAGAIGITHQHVGNMLKHLYDVGFLTREQQARPHVFAWLHEPPLPLHYFDRSPITLTGEAAEYAAGLLQRRETLNGQHD
jgi:hypothetical protein